MSDLAQGLSAKVPLNPGQVLRVSTPGVAVVAVLYGASQGATVTANSQTFGPYSVPAMLRITATSGTTSYGLERQASVQLGTDGKLYADGNEVAVAGGVSASQYVSAPAGWDTGWRAALASGTARLSAAGDSMTKGLLCSDLDVKSWVRLMAADLQAKYGDGGSGFKPSCHSVAGINSAAYTTALPAACLWATTGTWDQNLTNCDGPSGSVLQAKSAGATLTYTRARGTSIDIYFLNGNSAAFGSWSYQIDGGGWMSAGSTNTGAQGIGVRTINGLSAGNHTVQIRADDASSTVFFFFCGIRARNATGVRVDNYGRGSYIAQVFNNEVGGTFTTTGGQVFGGASSGLFGPAGKWSGGSLNPTDLAIWSFGLNNARFTTPTTTPQMFYRAGQQYLEDVRAGNPNASLMILMQHRGDVSFEDATNRYYSQYIGMAKQLADQFGAAFVDLWKAGKQSYSWMNGQGYWGNQNVPGAAGTDLVHFSDAGEVWAKNIITPLVI
ncbi:SGNH/GDSL hydrolase family protein [Roseateles terrae]|uniref:Lysophospholipase L1-like esterase n=1 Tax=Roseateles terrae TaxID=431060 RepID=A0ABR6GPA2_9BURK|nr:SGNH/GDSL hydrolase family protein [Roseateles terrae]MBB3193940.1 lysophospholipase L1-like esterase [Roseateles terrae]OWQ87818.1 hypothetical protein CDN98_06540 [Roseateles terrae]